MFIAGFSDDGLIMKSTFEDDDSPLASAAAAAEAACDVDAMIVVVGDNIAKMCCFSSGSSWSGAVFAITECYQIPVTPVSLNLSLPCYCRCVSALGQFADSVSCKIQRGRLAEMETSNYSHVQK